MLLVTKKNYNSCKSGNIVRNRPTRENLNVAKMRMLLWMSGHTREDTIRNECFRKNIRVAINVDEMVETHLRRFGVWTHAEKL